MPEFTAHGLNMDWGEPALDAVRGLRRVLVRATPADPSNVVRLMVSHGDGLESLVRAWSTGIDPETGAQRFVADLPASARRWRPILSNGVREADPGNASQEVEAVETAVPAPSPAAEPAGQVPDAESARRFGYRLEYFARATAPLDPDPIVIGDTPDGLHIVYPLAPGGTVIGPRINGTYNRHGGDWMRIRSDGMGVVGVRAVLQTSDGANLLTEYSGLVDFGRDGQQRLLSGNPPPTAEACLTPRFITSHPDWLWINRLQMIAFGRVTFATMLVEYDLYVMHSEAASKDTP